MKKLLLILCPILVIAALIYTVSIHGHASQSSKESYEHYYNTDDTYGKTNTSYHKDKNHSSSNSGPIRIPSSSNDSANTSQEETDLNSVTILINKNYTLDENYEPDDLVIPNIKFSFSNYDPKMQLRREAAEAMENLFQGAMEEGLQLAGVSGYRSYKRQFEIYASNLIRRGQSFTDLYSAYPGTSEHQTGLAMDISTSSIHYRLSDQFASTAEGIWVSEHCHEYGFIVRFPEDKTDITGYAYEPWHIRYVGIELATYLYENDMTLDEYYDYAYEDAEHIAIDYDAVKQEYYAMKGIKNPSSQTTYTASSDMNGNEYLEQDSNGEMENSQEEYEENPETENGDTASEPLASPTPTKKPSSSVKPSPSDRPSQKPAGQPTEKPTNEPSLTPTDKPSQIPTDAPADEPSKVPSQDPAGQEPSNDPVTPPPAEPTAPADPEPSTDPVTTPDPADLATPTADLPQTRSSEQPAGSEIPEDTAAGDDMASGNGSVTTE